MQITQKQPVIVISGTNASGKSALGIRLAQKYNAEIISADSRQIYRGFDLCCGKVTAEERALVPHHMLDVCSVGENYSVTDYQRAVYALIPEIAARGRLPMIVGGTGLYIDAVTKGYDFADETIDADFRQYLEEQSIETLQAMLSEDGREFFKDHPADWQNKRRLARAIEKERSGNRLDADNKPLFDVLQLGVTWPREMLHERIDLRLATRIAEGMLDEVGDYLKNGGNAHYLHKLGLEYKYIAWYFEKKYDSIAEFSAEMSAAIKKFAKQQVKWFRRDPAVRWIDMTADPFAEACAQIDTFLAAAVS